MIDRTNYEIWFTDFLDGKLTPAQQQALNTFLAQNPDLAEELSEFAATDMPTLAADAVDAPLPLKKQIVPVGTVHEANFEDAFIAAHEGDLTPEGKKDLDLFLQKNPFLHADYELFGKARVASAETMPRKNRLKHTPAVISIFRYSAAASVLLLLGLGVVRYTNTGNGSQTAEAVAYRPATLVSVPDVRPHVAGEGTDPNNGNVTESVQWATSVKNKRTPGGYEQTTVQTAEKRRMAENGVSVQFASVTTVESGAFDGELSTAKKLYAEPAKTPAAGDELTLVQAFGKAIENGLGKNGVSDGMQNKEKVTPGDVADLAATPFKENKTPILATETNAVGKRRFKVRLGIFEADFALR